MKRYVVFLLLMATTGCVSPYATPERISLSAKRLNVTMSNGIICRGDKTDQTINFEGWSGKLKNCPYPYEYKVKIDKLTNPLRYFTVELLTSLKGQDILSPIATVVMTDARGRHFEFVAPRRGLAARNGEKK